MEVTEVNRAEAALESVQPHQPRKWFMNTLKALISLALILWLLREVNLTEVIAAAQGVNLWLLLLAASLHLVGYWLSAIRWQILLRAQGTEASIPFLIQSYMVSTFFNNFLPSTVGGDAIRAYDGWRLGQSKSSALAVVFIDRFLGLLVLMLFALVALLLYGNLFVDIPALNLWVLFGVVGMVGGTWLLFSPAYAESSVVGRLQKLLPGKVLQLIKAFRAFRGQHVVFAKSFLLSVLLQANVVVHYYLIALAMGFTVPLYIFFLIIPLAIFIMMIPISINGIGLRENTFVFFLAIFGITAAEAIAFAWIGYLILLLQGVLGGIVYALRK